MRDNVNRKPKGQRRFLSVQEAAKYINRHRSTLDKWRAENIVLPYYQDGKKVDYDIDDLDDHLDSLRVTPVAYGVEQLAESRPEVAQNEEMDAGSAAQQMTRGMATEQSDDKSNGLMVSDSMPRKSVQNVPCLSAKAESGGVTDVESSERQLGRIGADKERK